ncbi:MAG TPA: glycosyltransferase family 4 protein [Vicinamibacterales bacterium]|nr:glycosyltransferase family 4 protein [Vicinamibacterales bacterium]
MRLAWFSPLPPTRSGIAAYSAELVPRLATTHAIDCFSRANAGDFLWKATRDPYDLVVYQLGNAPCHDFMWGYLAAYPGLVVLHDARLHQARAHDLLKQERFDDYRREFWYDHPDARRDFVEYAVAGLGGPIYYCWPMLRVVMRTARHVAVHNPRVAVDLRQEYPDTTVDAIHLGTPPFELDMSAHAAARARVRTKVGVPDEAVVFAAFGKMTAEKRIDAILRAFQSIAAERADVHLLLAGDTSEYPTIDGGSLSSSDASRIHVTGYVPDNEIGDYLAAADACLCLRWPTALETSAAWVQCLAARRPTVISDLAHLVDVPTIDPRGRRASPPHEVPVAMAVDLLDEHESLVLAMRSLAEDPLLRDSLGRAGHAYWQTHHSVDVMVRDYERLIERAAASPVPTVTDLPPHFTDDHSTLARTITGQLGFELNDVLGARR